MKALSIQQPWAWAILHAGKNVENRSWKHNHTGSLVIHTGKTFDREGYDFLRLALPSLSDVLLPPLDRFPRGGFVGTVTLDRYVRMNQTDVALGKFGPWAHGPWCWFLKDPVAFPDMVEAPGRLGVWEIPEGQLVMEP